MSLNYSICDFFWLLFLAPCCNISALCTYSLGTAPFPTSLFLRSLALESFPCQLPPPPFKPTKKSDRVCWCVVHLLGRPLRIGLVFWRAPFSFSSDGGKGRPLLGRAAKVVCVNVECSRADLVSLGLQ